MAVSGPAATTAKVFLFQIGSDEIIPFDTALMVEEFVPCKTEIAVLVAN